MKENKNIKTESYSNPYVMGVTMGLILLASFLFLGTGLGASSGMARIGAFFEGLILSGHVRSSEYFGQWGGNPLRYYLVFMFVGTSIGGFISAFLSNRLKVIVEKGKSFPRNTRLLFALLGGILIGFASRLAGGCTSGQALTGGALLLNGSLIFLFCLFAGGYATAYLVRRQWYD